METAENINEWAVLSPEEKRRQLFINQASMLQGFRERNAISEEEYHHSLTGLAEKMGFVDLLEEFLQNENKGESK